MHKIISHSKKKEIGAKAKNLIELDKASLCPNFMVLDNSVFLDHLKGHNINSLDYAEIKKITSNKTVDKKLLSQIKTGDYIKVIDGRVYNLVSK